MKPKKIMEIKFFPDGTPYRVYHEYCGKCEKFINKYFNFCPYCGEVIEREKAD